MPPPIKPELTLAMFSAKPIIKAIIPIPVATMKTFLLLSLCAAVHGEAAVIQEVSHFDTQKVRGAFLTRGVGARPIGMGEAFTAVADDASALALNPGGLGQVNSLNAVAMYGMFGNDQNLSYVAVALPVDFGVVGASLMALNYGSYDVRDANGVKMGTESPSDMGAVASWAFDTPGWLGGKGSTGVSVEFVKEAAGGTLLGLGAGGILPAGQGTQLGWAVQHLGPSQDGFSLPALAKVGGAYSASPTLRLAADIAYPLVDQQIWMAVGGEYIPFSDVTLRAGYKWQMESQDIEGLTGVTMGAGVWLGAFGLDYTYQPFGDLATSHRISLVYGLKPASAELVKTAQARPTAVRPTASSSSRADAEYQAGVVLYKARDYDGAWRKAYAALQANPKHWQSWAMIGNCQYAKGDRQSALASYQRSLAIYPDNPQLKAWVEKLKKQ